MTPEINSQKTKWMEIHNLEKEDPSESPVPNWRNIHRVNCWRWINGGGYTSILLQLGIFRASQISSFPHNQHLVRRPSPDEPKSPHLFPYVSVETILKAKYRFVSLRFLHEVLALFAIVFFPVMVTERHFVTDIYGPLFMFLSHWKSVETIVIEY